MSTQFCLARFAKLFIYEHKSSNFLRYITLFIILYSIIINIVRIFVITEVIDGVSPFLPIKITIIIGYLSVAFYYPLLKKEKRELHYMLPASNLEKYLSVLVNTVIVIPAFYILLNLVPLIWLSIKWSGEIPGLEYYSPSLFGLCAYIKTISIVTYLFFSFIDRSKPAEGIIILSLYWLSGPLRRGFSEQEHLVLDLIVIAILQILIYLRIKKIGE